MTLRLELLPHSTELNHAIFKVIEEHEVVLSNGFKLVIPEGYVTDLSTIPKRLHGILSPLHTAIREGGLVHDYLCDNWRWLQKDLPDSSSKLWCDLEYYRLCSGLNFWRRMFLLVVLLLAPKAHKMYYD